MATTTSRTPDNIDLPLRREPLRPRTTSPISPLSSIIKQVRRKNSFLSRADSSDEYPSSHSSIYEAFYFSGATSDDSGSRIELATIPRPLSTSSNRHAIANNENLKEPITPLIVEPPILPEVGEIEFLYGHGTILQTITEQQSRSTLARRRSADNLSTSQILGHRDSFMLCKGPRGKFSFSLDDLNSIKRSYHEACTTIEYEARKQRQIPEIYAQPKTPIQAPPNRTPTPPGMPSWDASQNILNSTPRYQQRPQRVQGKQNRFQRFFNFSGNSSMMMSTPGVAPAPNYAMSMPVRGRMAPRFRPPRSAYGPIDQHPFTRAPIAKPNESSSHVRTLRNVLTSPPTLTRAPTGFPTAEIRQSKKRNRLGLRVRFTPSATARDSEMLNVQNAMEATSRTAVHPFSPLPFSLSPRPKPTCESKVKPCPHQKAKAAKPKSRAGNTSTPPNNAPNTNNGLDVSLVIIPPSTQYLPLTLQFSPLTPTMSRDQFLSPPGTQYHTPSESPIHSPSRPSTPISTLNPTTPQNFPYLTPETPPSASTENQTPTSSQAGNATNEFSEAPSPSPLKAPNCPSFAASSRRQSLEIREADLNFLDPVSTVRSWDSRTHIMSGALLSPTPSLGGGNSTSGLSPSPSPSPTPSPTPTPSTTETNHLLPLSSHPNTTTNPNPHYAFSSGEEALPFSNLNPEEESETEIKQKWCWKCQVEKVKEGWGKWWIGCRDGVCLACCGFDDEFEEEQRERIGDMGGERRGERERGMGYSSLRSWGSGGGGGGGLGRGSWGERGGRERERVLGMTPGLG